MEGKEKSENRFKVTKGIGLIIFGIVIFSLGYVISNEGETYSIVTFLIMYIIGIPSFLIGVPIIINEILPKFSQRLVLITGVAIIMAYGIFWIYTLISH